MDPTRTRRRFLDQVAHLIVSQMVEGVFRINGQTSALEHDPAVFAANQLNKSVMPWLPEWGDVDGA